QRNNLPVISIVGYTNAGKSTLLNALTASEVLVADQLFATLDTTTRRLRFPREREAIVTDTVGFIRDLPADLMKAFRATLEELETADLLLHVVDISDPMLEEKMKTVDDLLEELDLSSIPRLLILNKSDLVEDFEATALAQKYDAIALSATTRKSLRDLVDALAWKLWQQEFLPETDAWSVPSAEDLVVD
ncbi:50S ribosome-binding GTPase, partial [Myxococcota bacterium]|nr:50S ribosome-binding GTPase [Myxococcota bacterium]